MMSPVVRRFMVVSADRPARRPRIRSAPGESLARKFSGASVAELNGQLLEDLICRRVFLWNTDRGPELVEPEQ
jgi:hypothetical protein